MRFSKLAILALVLQAAHGLDGGNSTIVDRELKGDSRVRRGPPPDPEDGGPRFRKGEIIVKGSPLDLPAGVKVVRYLEKANLTVIKVTRGREKSLVKKLRKKGKMAEENFEVFASAFTPNDTYFQYQWHLQRVQAPDVWALNDGQGVTVAVLDTGLADTGHDGINCVEHPRNTINNSDNVHDGDGHGTHVSGTIAQRTDNGRGVAGLAHGACLMPVKVLGDDGSGSFADIAEGIYWAVQNGAKVINMSLGVDASSGMTSDGGAVDAALQYAYSQGVTVVAASGNDYYGENVSYPSSYPTVISVGATDCVNGRSSYSNYGTGLDLVAPGGDTSIDRDGDGFVDGVLQETMTGGTVSFKFYQGTSMASPHAAAAAAMVISAAGGSLGPTEVKAILKNTALDVGSSNEYGAGLIQVKDAVSSLSTGPSPTPQPISAPQPTPQPISAPQPTPQPITAPQPTPQPVATPQPTPQPTRFPTPQPVTPTRTPTAGTCSGRRATCNRSAPTCCPEYTCNRGRMGKRDQCK